MRLRKLDLGPRPGQVDHKLAACGYGKAMLPRLPTTAQLRRAQAHGDGFEAGAPPPRNDSGINLTDPSAVADDGRHPRPDPRPMTRHHYRCPRCAALLGADRDLSGHKVQCLGCQEVFTARVHTPAPEPQPDPVRTPSETRTARRPLLPFALAGTVMALAGLGLGIAALATADPPPDPGPVAQAPAEPQPDPEPAPAPPTVLPLSS